MDVNSMLDIDSGRLCRLCLENNGEMVYIFDPKGYNGFRVWEIIKELLQLEVSREDGLPRTICRGCLKKVAEFKHFKTVCIKSKITILTMIASRGIVGCCSTQDMCKTKQGAQKNHGDKVEIVPLDGSTLSHEIMKILDDDVCDKAGNTLSSHKDKNINKTGSRPNQSSTSQGHHKVAADVSSEKAKVVPDRRERDKDLKAVEAKFKGEKSSNKANRPKEDAQNQQRMASQSRKVPPPDGNVHKSRASGRKPETGNTEERTTSGKQQTPEKTTSGSSPIKKSISLRESTRAQSRKSLTERTAKLPRLETPSSSSEEVADNDMSVSRSESKHSESSASSVEKEVLQATNVSVNSSGSKHVLKRSSKALSNSKRESAPPSADKSNINAEVPSVSRSDDSRTIDTQKKTSKGPKGKGSTSKAVPKVRGRRPKEVTVASESDSSGTVNFIEVPVTEDAVSIISEVTNEFSADPLAPIKTEVLDREPAEEAQLNQRQKWVPGAIYDSVYSNLGPVKQECIEPPVSEEGDTTVAENGDSYVEPSISRQHSVLNSGEIGTYVPMEVDPEESTEVEMEFEELKYSELIKNNKGKEDTVVGETAAGANRREAGRVDGMAVLSAENTSKAMERGGRLNFMPFMSAEVIEDDWPHSSGYDETNGHPLAVSDTVSCVEQGGLIEMIPKQQDMRPSCSGQHDVSLDPKQTTSGQKNPVNSVNTFNKEPAVSDKDLGTKNKSLDPENKEESSTGNTTKEKEDGGVNWKRKMLEECFSKRFPRICLERVDWQVKAKAIDNLKSGLSKQVQQKQAMSPIPSTSTADQLRADIGTDARRTSNVVDEDFEILEVFKASEGVQRSRRTPLKETIPADVDSSGSDNEEWTPCLWHSEDEDSSDSNSSEIVRSNKRKAKDKPSKGSHGKKSKGLVPENIGSNDKQTLTSPMVDVRNNLVSSPTSGETGSAANDNNSSTVTAQTSLTFTDRSVSIDLISHNSQQTAIPSPVPGIKTIQPKPNAKPKPETMPTNTKSTDRQPQVSHSNPNGIPTLTDVAKPQNVPSSTAADTTPVANKNYKINIYRGTSTQEPTAIFRVDTGTNPGQTLTQMPKQCAKVDVVRENDVLTEPKQGTGTESSTSGLIQSKKAQNEHPGTLGSGEGVSTVVGMMPNKPIRIPIIPSSAVPCPVRSVNCETVVKAMPHAIRDLQITSNINAVQTFGSNGTDVPGKVIIDINGRIVDPGLAGTVSVHGFQRIPDQPTKSVPVSSGMVAATQNVGMSFSVPVNVNTASSSSVPVTLPDTVPAQSSVPTITNLPKGNQFVVFQKVFNPVPTKVPIPWLSTSRSVLQPVKATSAAHANLGANEAKKMLLLKPVSNVDLRQPDNAIQLASVPKPMTYMLINSAGDGNAIQWQETRNQLGVVQNVTKPQTVMSCNVVNLKQMPSSGVQQLSSNVANGKGPGQLIMGSAPFNSMAVENLLAPQNMVCHVSGNVITWREGSRDSSDKTAPTSSAGQSQSNVPVVVSREPSKPTTECGTRASSGNVPEPGPSPNCPQGNIARNTCPGAANSKTDGSSPGPAVGKRLEFKFHSMQGAVPGVVPKNFMVKCRWCETMFTDPEILTAHMSEKHNEELSKVLQQAKAASLNKTVPLPAQQRSQAPEWSAERRKDGGRVPQLVNLSDDEDIPPRRSPSPVGEFKCKYCPEILSRKSRYREHRKVFHSSRHFKRRHQSRGREEDSGSSQPKRQVQTVPPFYVSPRTVYMNTPVGRGPTKISTSTEQSQSATNSKVLDVITILDNNPKPTVANKSSPSKYAGISILKNRVDSQASASVIKKTGVDPVASKESESIEKVDKTESCSLVIEKQKEAVGKDVLPSQDVAQRLAEENLNDAVVFSTTRPDTVKVVDNLTSVKQGNVEGRSNKSLNLNDSIPSTSKAAQSSDCVVLDEQNVVKQPTKMVKDGRELNLSESNGNTSNEPTKEPVKDGKFNSNDITANSSSKTCTQPSTELVQDEVLQSNDSAAVSTSVTSTSSGSTATGSANNSTVKPNNKCTTGDVQWKCILVDEKVSDMSCPMCPMKFNGLSSTWEHMLDSHNLPDERTVSKRRLRRGPLKEGSSEEVAERIKCSLCTAKFFSILACANHFKLVHLPKL